MNRDHQGTPEMERRTYNLWPETARILGLGKNAVYAAAERGDIPTIRIGGRLLVPKVALDRLLTNAGEAATVGPFGGSAS